MPLNYTLGEEVDDIVRGLIERVGETRSPDLIREMAVTALKLVEDGALRGDLKILNSALKELRHSFRLFAPLRGIRKTSIFGSARLRPESPEYRLTEDLAGLLVRSGYLVITGAGPGIMEAGNRGAGEGGSFGLAIRLPSEPEANRYIRRPDRLINFKYFFTRKLVFIKESDAVVLLPGGFGTLDECFELLTLLQTGKCDPRPVILIDPEGSGYWTEWLRFARSQLIERGLIDRRDLSLLTLCHSPEETLSEIRAFYSTYHSSRYVGDRLLLRLERPPTDLELSDWTDRFADLISSGHLERATIPTEEPEDPAMARLHAIQFAFNRSSFARLRELIDAINGLERRPGACGEPG